MFSFSFKDFRNAIVFSRRESSISVRAVGIEPLGGLLHWVFPLSGFGRDARGVLPVRVRGSLKHRTGGHDRLRLLGWEKQQHNRKDIRLKYSQLCGLGLFGELCWVLLSGSALVVESECL